MTFCPLIREKCKEGKCAFWLAQVPIGGKCAIFWIGLYMTPTEVKKVDEKVLNELKRKSPRELAEEMIQFVKEVYPLGFRGGYIPFEVKRLFWEKKGITYVDDPELYEKKLRAEALVSSKFEEEREEKFNVDKLVEFLTKDPRWNTIKFKKQVRTILREKYPDIDAFTLDKVCLKIETEFPGKLKWRA